MASSLQFSTTSTIAVLERQQEQLKKTVQEKQNQITRLREVQESIVFQTGQVSEITRMAQNVLIKAPFQSPLEHSLQPSQPEHPLEQWNQLINMAKKVQQGEFASVMNKHIEKLNETVGNTAALAEDFEGKIQKLDQTIEFFQRQIEKRKETIALSKQLTQELIEK